MKYLYKKELNYYLNNPIGYIVVILFAVFANFLFVKDIFVVNSASMQPFFSLVPWLFTVFIPALTMRSFAEEKKTNTIEVLLSQPVTELSIVIAKFLAVMTLITISLALTLALPISLSFLAKMYLPEILVAYIGELLLAGGLVSLGLFFSSLTENQIVAFLSSAIVSFLLMVIGSDFVASIFPKVVLDFSSYYSPLYQLDAFTKGLLDLRGVVYFLSLTLVFVAITVVNLERRK